MNQHAKPQHKTKPVRAPGVVIALALAAAAACVAQAEQPPTLPRDASTPAAAASAAPAASVASAAASATKAASAAASQPGLPETGSNKDVVLDRPATQATVPAAPPPLVQTPSQAPAAAGSTSGSSGSGAAAARLPSEVRRPANAAQDQATASALAELALDLLRAQSDATGDAQVNGVVSSLSVASALGLVHAGTTGAGARELANLVASPGRGEQRGFTQRLPSVLDRLTETGKRTGAFTMANRVWLDQAVVASVPLAYAATVANRFGADGAVVPFDQAEASRKAINGWVAEKTAKRIPELMPAGSITPTTRVVLTNAIYFKSPWAQPFDPAKTTSKPFFVAPNAPKQVPTMSDERTVRQAVVDNVTVYELPFAGNEFSLMVGMPPAGHSLDAFEKDLDGIELAAWSGQLKPQTCRFEMPKFTIAPDVRPLKQVLQALGVKTVFSPDADLSAMLGKAGKGVQVDNVFHSATIVIDEQGGEAAAATGASGAVKSFSLPAPACPVNRPFIFAVLHKATGALLFVGKVADPSKT